MNRAKAIEQILSTEKARQQLTDVIKQYRNWIADWFSIHTRGHSSTETYFKGEEKNANWWIQYRREHGWVWAQKDQEVRQSVLE